VQLVLTCQWEDLVKGGHLEEVGEWLKGNHSARDCCFRLGSDLARKRGEVPAKDAGQVGEEEGLNEEDAGEDLLILCRLPAPQEHERLEKRRPSHRHLEQQQAV